MVVFKTFKQYLFSIRTNGIREIGKISDAEVLMNKASNYLLLMNEVLEELEDEMSSEQKNKIKEEALVYNDLMERCKNQAKAIRELIY